MAGGARACALVSADRVASIDIHALGGVCCWSGDATAIDRARIAWGGVLAQAVAFVMARAALQLAGAPDGAFVAQLASAFTTTNVWMIAINLIPVAPLDGAAAWKLPGLLAAQRRTRAGATGSGFKYEREAATLQRYADEPPELVKTAVDDALQRIVGDTKKPKD